MPVVAAIPAALGGISAAGAMGAGGLALGAAGLGMQASGMGQPQQSDWPTGYNRWHLDMYDLPAQNAFLRLLGFETVPGTGGKLQLKTSNLQPMPMTQAALDRQKKEEQISISETKAGFGSAMDMVRRYGSIMMPEGAGGGSYLTNRVPLMMAENIAEQKAAGGLERARIVEAGEKARLAGIQAFMTGNAAPTSGPVTPGSQLPGSLMGLGQDLLGAGTNLYTMNQLSDLMNSYKTGSTTFQAPSIMNPQPTYAPQFPYNQPLQ